MSGRLEGKVALVMGAGSIGPGWGNGKAAAVLFAREGAKVMACDVNRDAAEETKGHHRGRGRRRAGSRSATSPTPKQVAATVDACLSAYGRIDVLHNNVGIASLGGPVELDEAEWDRVNDVNLKSVYLTCKYALPHMERAGRGAIVNIASIAGIRWTGVPYIAYSTTKGAVIQFTRAVALQYASEGYPRQRHPAGPDEHADGPCRPGRRLWRQRRRDGAPARRAMPDGPYGRRLGRRTRRAVPGLGRGALYHRRGVGGRWRLDRVMRADGGVRRRDAAPSQSSGRG